jgi:hypothetical protein
MTYQYNACLPNCPQFLGYFSVFIRRRSPIPALRDLGVQ